MSSILANWKKTAIFCVVYAIVTAIVLTLLSMEPAMILRIVILSTAIMAGIINFVGVFPRKE